MLLVMLAFIGLFTMVRSQVGYAIDEQLAANSIIANLVDTLSLSKSAKFALPKDYGLFQISALGVLTTKKIIDRDAVDVCRRQTDCDYLLEVSSVNGADIRIHKITITINDINDNAPVWEDFNGNIEIKEDVAVNYEIDLPKAADYDSPNFGIDYYQLDNPHTDAFYFDVDRLKLISRKELDRENKAVYDNFLLRCSDKGGRRSEIRFSIKLTDVNDNWPQCLRPIFQSTVNENIKGGSLLVKAEARDVDENENAKITYSLSVQSSRLYGKIISVNENNGQVYLRDGVSLDYETDNLLKLDVIARDSSLLDPKQTTCSVEISIRDVNDERPDITITVFNEASRDRVEIREDARPNDFVAQVGVTDADTTADAGSFDCLINNKNFSLQLFDDGGNRKNYKLILAVNNLDRELFDMIRVTVTCQDHGTPPLNASRIVDVYIVDVNDNAPTFQKNAYQANLDENNAIGVNITTVTAIDLDARYNGKVLYSLTGKFAEYFLIGTHTGLITANRVFDREKNSVYNLSVIAYDMGVPSLSSAVKLTIFINDLDDSSPIFEQTAYVIKITEQLDDNFDDHNNNNNNNMVDRNVEIGSVRATDADSDMFSQFIYVLEDNTNTFVIEPYMGKIFRMKKLDRETRDVYDLNVMAVGTTGKKLTGRCTLKIIVLDLNDHSPFFKFPNPFNNTIRISSHIPVGHSIATVLATDKDIGRNGEFGFTTKSEEFVLSTISGDLKTAIDFQAIEYRVYVINVTVSDYGSPSKSMSANLTIIVNKSIAFVSSNNKGDANMAGSSNTTIVIIVASVSAVIAAVLIAAIFYLKFKDRYKYDRREKLDNTRMENNDANKLYSVSMKSPRENWQANRQQTTHTSNNYDDLQPADSDSGHGSNSLENEEDVMLKLNIRNANAIQQVQRARIQRGLTASQTLASPTIEYRTENNEICKASHV